MPGMKQQRDRMNFGSKLHRVMIKGILIGVALATIGVVSLVLTFVLNSDLFFLVSFVALMLGLVVMAVSYFVAWITSI